MRILPWLIHRHLYIHKFLRLTGHSLTNICTWSFPSRCSGKIPSPKITDSDNVETQPIDIMSVDPSAALAGAPTPKMSTESLSPGTARHQYQGKPCPPKPAPLKLNVGPLKLGPAQKDAAGKKQKDCFKVELLWLVGCCWHVRRHACRSLFFQTNKHYCTKQSSFAYH